MRGVVVGHDAWGIVGNNKEGSALDSPFVSRIGSLGGLNLPLFAQAYMLSVVLTAVGSTSLNRQSWQHMEKSRVAAFLLVLCKVIWTMIYGHGSLVRIWLIVNNIIYIYGCMGFLLGHFFLVCPSTLHRLHFGLFPSSFQSISLRILDDRGRPGRRNA
ncbi:uncharacterized protein G2W53_004637 [Senna tora]|uniref:Uncharacterized protein n=1 Tax=Senna tora TaxID=362788 RepID=A0A835CHE8_9FABA|nr:uncharacterized protein G2W53_004637 [Senna tora]